MDNKDYSTASPKSKNRARFYSHQVDDEHTKVLKPLNPIKENSEDGSEGNSNSQKSATSQKVCKDPADLLEGISDMFVNSELGVNYTKPPGGVDWNMLSNSILNKFSPGHTIFRQQLELIKTTQEDFLDEQRTKDNLEKKKILRQQQKGYDVPQNLNELQRKMIERSHYRQKLYADNPDMLKLAELKDMQQINKIHMEMIINGCKFDKDGNIVRKKKTHRDPIGKSEYGNVKSRFRENTNLIPGGYAPKPGSSKNVNLYKARSTNDEGITKLYDRLNHSEIKKPSYPKRKRFYTEGSNDYISNLAKFNECENKNKALLEARRRIRSENSTGSNQLYYSKEYVRDRDNNSSSVEPKQKEFRIKTDKKRVNSMAKYRTPQKKLSNLTKLAYDKRTNFAPCDSTLQRMKIYIKSIDDRNVNQSMSVPKTAI